MVEISGTLVFFPGLYPVTHYLVSLCQIFIDTVDREEYTQTDRIHSSGEVLIMGSGVRDDIRPGG